MISRHYILYFVRHGVSYGNSLLYAHSTAATPNKIDSIIERSDSERINELRFY